MDKEIEAMVHRNTFLTCLEWRQAGRNEYEMNGRVYPWNALLACARSLETLNGLMGEW